MGSHTLCWLSFKAEVAHSEETDAVGLPDVRGQPELQSECEASLNGSVRYCLWRTKIPQCMLHQNGTVSECIDCTFEQFNSERHNVDPILPLTVKKIHEKHIPE